MPRAVSQLTALKVGRLVGKPGMYPDGGGLYLQVTERGASWIYRFMLNGRAREMGLGPLALYGLQEARAKVLDARKLRHEGIDPIEARNAARLKLRLDAAKAMMFKDCAEAYIRAHRAGWRNAKHAAQWESTLLTYAGPFFGDLPVQAVDTSLVMRVLEQEIRGGPDDEPCPLWLAKPETASRLRGRIEAILDWAKVRGYREGENPARWRGHLDKLLPARAKVQKVQHHAALPYAQLPAFISALRAEEGVAARALEFAILTAARTGEVIGARWNEINRDDRVWTVPSSRMKSCKEHRVPLGSRALAILGQMGLLIDQPPGTYVFPGGKRGRPLSNMAFLMLLKRMGRGDLTAHGFRSTFRDWAAERTNYPSEVAEMALAHTITSKVEQAYRRGDLFDRRRRMMADWGSFTATPVSDEASTVVQLRS